MDDVNAGNVQKVTVTSNELHGSYRNSKNGDQFHTTVPANYPDMVSAMRTHGVDINYKDAQNNNWMSWLIQLSPLIIIAALWFFMLRQMQAGGNKALSFGKSRARLLSMQQKKVTFKDVAGCDEAKEELKEIIEFLRAAGRASRNRQDPAGARRRRRSERAVLLHLRFGLRGDVRRRRREPRPRPV
jgi:cell division protease FtsH